MKIAIIGTAGRRRLVPLSQVELMYRTSRDVLDSLSRRDEAGRLVSRADGSPVVVVSGGAAVADHTAVLLFLQSRKPISLPFATTPLQGTIDLDLYLPCPWDSRRKRFQDTGVVDWKTNPGGTANHYHRKYSRHIFGNDAVSLHHIALAIELGARTVIGKGFHGRNTSVARSDMVLAFASGKSAPEDGGTLDTWRKAKAFGADCHHFSLT